MVEGMAVKDEEKAIAPATTPKRSKRNRGCRLCACSCLLLLFLVIILVLILSLTIFKVKPPKINLVSTRVQGIAPKFTFPTMKVELNITLNLTILVNNPNRVTFKSGQGEALLLYNGDQVGNVLVDPGFIPSKGSTTLVCLLTLEADRFADSGVMSLVRDITDGELALEVKTRVPGRAKILGFKKHVVTSSDCQIVIGFPDMKIKSQDCKQHTKL